MRNKTTYRFTAPVIGLCFFLFAGLTFAAAGHVEFSTGDARILRGKIEMQASKEASVQSGDVLRTGLDGRMRIRMTNGEQIALHPNTEFVIDEYTAPRSESRPETGRSFYTFVKGGFDAVVKSVGRRDISSYRVRTSVATMGIRGTAYTAVWGVDGLYIQVTEGSVTVTNAAGTLTITAGQIGFVGLNGAAPILVDSMPAVGVGVSEGTGFGTGLGVPLGVLGGLGILAIIVGNDGDGGDDTTTSTTTSTTTTTTTTTTP